MTANPPLHRGFTLIEVLVALALMAMIATILLSSLQIAGHTWQRVMGSTANTEDIAQAQELLRQNLSSLYPYQRMATEVSRPPFLVSDGTSLEFSGSAPQSLTDGMLRYQIAVSPNTAALELRSRRDRNGLSDPSASQWTTEPFLSHVATLDVQFWLKPDDLPGRWIDHWVDATEIPRLIRIEVGFPPGDHRRWPTLYIEPRVDTPANCVFDVVSRRCRSDS
jgi:general secretion pathway protein J